MYNNRILSATKYHHQSVIYPITVCIIRRYNLLLLYCPYAGMYAWLNIPWTGFSSVSVALMAAASLADAGCTANDGWWARGGRGTWSIGRGGASGAVATAAEDLTGAGERVWAVGAETGAGTVMGTGADLAVIGVREVLTSLTAAERATEFTGVPFDVVAGSDMLMSGRLGRRARAASTRDVIYDMRVTCIASFVNNTHASLYMHRL